MRANLNNRIQLYHSDKRLIILDNLYNAYTISLIPEIRDNPAFNARLYSTHLNVCNIAAKIANAGVLVFIKSGLEDTDNCENLKIIKAPSKDDTILVTID
jgi:hypothetical protein